jgi:hypothetical protein
MGKVKSLLLDVDGSVVHADLDWRVEDADRVRYNLEAPHDDYEYRYEERGGEYFLREWHDGIERSSKGAISDRPAWLVSIVDVARVGGRIKFMEQPPPECICWFATDSNRDLTNFIDLT